MRKFMMLGMIVALVVAALALPALAQDRILGENREDYYENLWDSWEDLYGESAGWEAFEDNYEDGFEEEGFFAFGDDSDEFRFFEEDDFFGEDGFFFDEDSFEDDDLVDDDNAAGISQSFDQQAESGDVSQSFTVTGGGDNSNQCAGIQGVSNTGNAQNQIGVIQYGSEADDFGFEDSGASINVSPTNSTSCDQQVNQAATAYYGGGR